MQEKAEEQDKKPPIEMTTDEALEYVFGSEIAEELRRQAGKTDAPDRPDEKPE